MSIQKTVNSKVKNRLVAVSKTCGDCSGFNGECLISGQKKVCSQADKISTSKACNKFRPDLTNVTATDLELVAQIMDRVSVAGLRALSVLMASASKSSKHGYKFMERVFVRYRGISNRNYRSNFMECYVMVADKRYVRLTSRDGACTLTYDGVRCAPVLFREPEFRKLEAEMIARGNLVDPDTQSLIIRKLRCEEEYELNITADSLLGEVSTIDSVFKENKVKKAKASGVNNLVEAVEDMAGDYLRAHDEKEAESESEDENGEDDLPFDFDEEEEAERQAAKTGIRVHDMSGM